MKQLFYLIALLSFFACGPARKTVQAIEPQILNEGHPIQEFAPDRLIIMYDEEIGKAPLEKAIQAYKAEVIYDYSIIPAMAIKLPEGSDIKAAIQYFKQVKGVVSVERDRIYRLTDPVRPGLEIM